MSRHATALYCNAAPYVLYRDMSLGIIVFLMRAAIILYYQSVCVCVFFFLFSNFTAGCKMRSKAAFV